MSREDELVFGVWSAQIGGFFTHRPSTRLEDVTFFLVQHLVTISKYNDVCRSKYYYDQPFISSCCSLERAPAQDSIPAEILL